jgi:hypothetical protein
MSEQVPVHEPHDPRQEAVTRAIAEGITRVRQRFTEDMEAGNLPEFPYHNEQHTRVVIARVEEILAALFEAGVTVPEKIREQIRIAAAWHDVGQYGETRFEENTERKLFVRYPGAYPGERTDDHVGNERLSIEEVQQWMHEQNIAAGYEIYDIADRTAMEMIVATVPGWDNVRATVVQPHLTNESPIGAWVLALSDLGTAGMRGADAFIAEGDALFREERIHVRLALERYASLSEKNKEDIRQEMLKWSTQQETFVQGRKDACADEIARMPIPAFARDHLHATVFTCFDQSIEGAKKEHQLRETMTLEALAQRMGYDVPHADVAALAEEFEI